MATIRELVDKMVDEEPSGDLDITKIATMIEGVQDEDPSVTEEDVAQAIMLEKIAAEIATDVEVTKTPGGDSTEKPMEAVKAEAKKIIGNQPKQPPVKQQAVAPKTAPPTNEEMTNSGDQLIEKKETIKVANDAYAKGEEIATRYYEEMSKHAEEILPKIAAEVMPVADPKTDLTAQSFEAAPATAVKDNLKIEGEGQEGPQDTNVASTPKGDEKKKTEATAIEKLRQKIVEKTVTVD